MIKVYNGVAIREPLPAALAALLPETLMHLQTALTPVPPDFIGMEWWPEVSDYPQYDRDSETTGDEVLTVDAAARVARVNWPVLPLPADVLAQRLASGIAALLPRIDSEADAIYARVLGNRATEYAQAEAEAGAFRDAGYVGDVPHTIADWAAIKQKSSAWAADDILATAAAWRNAQMAIRGKRLACKEQARCATMQAELNAAGASWDQFCNSITAQLGLGA